MTLDELLQLMQTNPFRTVIETLKNYVPYPNEFKDSEQFNPYLHDVMNKATDKRPDKVIGGGVDPETKAEIPINIIRVNRIALAMQKKIVRFATAFLGRPAIDSNPQTDDEKALVAILKQIWETSKLDYRFNEIATIVMSERHCAELWFISDVEESYWAQLPIDINVKLSMKLLANSKGDQLYPVFDEYGDMIAFGRGYQIKEIINNKAEVVPHFDLYAPDFIYRSKELNGGTYYLQVAGGDYAPNFIGLKNPIGKIPIIYYSQPQVEWKDVQPLIERLETKLSNHADTNDYYDSPILKATGDIQGFSSKGESGKLVELEQGADIAYLTWDSAPASMEMEIKNLLQFIHTLSHTPNVTFETIKGISQISGIALRLLFLDADIKAEMNEPIYAEGIQRRINFLKTAISVLDETYKVAAGMPMKPRFDEFLQQDPSTVITTLNAAVAGGIMSQQTAIQQNPLILDPEAEKELIDGEAAKAQADALAMAQATKPAAVPPTGGN
jgi:hypothetical protein